MKKLFTLTLLFFTFFTGSLLAQSLDLTEWAVYESEGADPTYYIFGLEELSASEDGDDFTVISIYSSTDTELWLHDITSDNGCNVADTGRYTFEIISDTLHFTLVVDPCGVRQETFIDAYWVQLALGVEDVNPLKATTMYPNPAQDQFTISLQRDEQISIQLIDFSGRVVKNDTYTQRVVNVDISELAIGIYFVQLKQGEFVETRRLVKSK